MAKYQRDFLISYIKDMTALHLALHKLEARLEQLERQKCALERGIHRSVQPQKPRYKLANGGFLMGIGVFTLISSLWMFVMKLAVLGCFGIVGGLMGITAGSLLYHRTAQENACQDRIYSLRLMEYQKLKLKNQQEREAIPGIEAEMAECEAEICRVKDALQTVHDADIIPARFRNVSAAIFLHSWFGQGGSGDLDAALNTYALVESNISLEQMIAGEGECLLKEYLHPAQPSETSSPATAYFASATYLASL